MQEAANRLGVQDAFEQGLALETRTSLQARQMPETARYRAAIAAYQQVADRYPTHIYAMEALWRLGRIAVHQLHDLDRAEAAYQKLIEQFPEGKYRERAIVQLNDIRRKQAHRHRPLIRSAR